MADPAPTRCVSMASSSAAQTQAGLLGPVDPDDLRQASAAFRAVATTDRDSGLDSLVEEPDNPRFGVSRCCHLLYT